MSAKGHCLLLIDNKGFQKVIFEPNIPPRIMIPVVESRIPTVDDNVPEYGTVKAIEFTFTHDYQHGMPVYRQYS